MKSLVAASLLPWVCIIGNFNEVLRADEHMGTGQCQVAQIVGFRDAVDVCNLADWSYQGRSWTFEKKITGGSYARMRLDRAFANPAWINRFPQAVLRHQTVASSDHDPMVLQMFTPESRGRRGRPLFQYELYWERHKNLRESMGL